MAGRARGFQNAIELLNLRGCIADSTKTQELAAYLSEPRTFYAGFDPTADSLHVGHLSVLMMMRRLQEQQHRPIVLIGGATGLIGDPSGRDSERPLIPEEKIQENARSIAAQINKFLDFSPDSSCHAKIVNNIDWYRPMSVISFLRDTGKHFKISAMLSRDSVKSRMNSHSGLTLTEFAYQTLQATDFLILAQRHDCLLQIGGADQWGNIVSGINLIRDKMDRKAHGITAPLLLSKSGVKLGKSTGGSVWLCPEKTSPYNLYQYLLNTDDSQVFTLLRTWTSLSLSEIDSLEVREAQMKLAECVTQLVHGRDSLEKARTSTERLFLNDTADLSKPLDGVPEFRMSRLELMQSSLASLLHASGVVHSRTEGRRLITAGGLRLNGKKETDPTRTFGPNDIQGDACLLQIGKRKRIVIRASTLDSKPYKSAV